MLEHSRNSHKFVHLTLSTHPLVTHNVCEIEYSPFYSRHTRVTSPVCQDTCPLYRDCNDILFNPLMSEITLTHVKSMHAWSGLIRCSQMVGKTNTISCTYSTSLQRDGFDLRSDSHSPLSPSLITLTHSH